MRLDTVEIKGLIEASLIEWPGRIAAVVFLPGCNLRCRYCHARDIVAGRQSLEAIPLEKALEFIGGKKGWIDGVVISGGEPTLDAGLPALAGRLKAMGLAVKLDTNGTRPMVLQRLISGGLVDAVSMDVKAPLDYRYFQITRAVVNLDDIRRSIGVIMRSGIEYEFRTTVSPFLMSPLDVAEIAQSIEGARRYTLQPFNPHVCLDRSLEEHPPCPMSFMEDAARLAKGFVGEVSIRK